MAQKCLIAATIAALLCHPRTTIRCFSPETNDNESRDTKPNSSSSAANTSSQNHKPKPKPKPTCPHAKSEEKLKPNSGFSYTTSSQGFVNRVSKVSKGDPSFDGIETIIRSSWLDKTSLKIKKVYRVSHTVSTLFKFEQKRKKIELKYLKSISGGFNERLAVDGNEILQFYGAVVSCSLGAKSKGSSSDICEKEGCGVCRILSSNFSVGSVSFFDTSWEAHEKVITNGVCGRKAIIVCRVIAGRTRIRRDQRGLMDGEEGGVDSIATGSSKGQFSGGEELFISEPKAVLPCFVVTYCV